MSRLTILPLSLGRLHEDILAVADAAGLDRSFLLGLSHGLSQGVSFAARHPGRVLGIIGRGG